MSLELIKIMFLNTQKAALIRINSGWYALDILISGGTGILMALVVAILPRN